METTGKIAPMTSDMPPESRRPIKARQQVWVHRLAHVLVGAGVTPNQMSAASVVAAALGAVAYGGAAWAPAAGGGPPGPGPRLHPVAPSRQCAGRVDGDRGGQKDPDRRPLQ